MLAYASFSNCICIRNIAVIITSKSGAAAPINCSQTPVFAISSNILRSFCIIKPTEETDIMIRELGAMISDIQKYGDYGIEKWKK